MIHADPWNEIERLERLLETDLLMERERSRIYASAGSFCVETCRVDGRCPLAHALQSTQDCPLWAFARAMPGSS
jgi:hypothetical protein